MNSLGSNDEVILVFCGSIPRMPEAISQYRKKHLLRLVLVNVFFIFMLQFGEEYGKLDVNKKQRRGKILEAINNLFNLLLHSKLVETFSKGSAIFLLAVFIILLLFCTAYIIIGTISNNYFSKRFLTCWIIESVLLSLLATFFVGRSFDCISKTGKPIKYTYTTTVTKSVNQSLSKIANKFPYVLILNDPNHNSNANTQYYIFSNSSDEIKNFNTEFNTDGPYQLVFLKSNNNTVVIKATFNDDGFLQNYGTVNHIGLPSNDWSAKFTNTNQMKIQDLQQ